MRLEHLILHPSGRGFARGILSSNGSRRAVILSEGHPVDPPVVLPAAGALEISDATSSAALEGLADGLGTEVTGTWDGEILHADTIIQLGDGQPWPVEVEKTVVLPPVPVWLPSLTAEESDTLRQMLSREEIYGWNSRMEAKGAVIVITAGDAIRVSRQLDGVLRWPFRVQPSPWHIPTFDSLKEVIATFPEELLSGFTGAVHQYGTPAFSLWIHHLPEEFARLLEPFPAGMVELNIYVVPPIG